MAEPRYSRKTFAVVTAVCLLAAAAVAAAFRFAASSGAADVEAAVFFSLAAAVAEGLSYRLAKGGFGSIAFIPFLASLAVSPSTPVIIGAGTAVLIGEYFHRRESIRVVFNVAATLVAMSVATLTFAGLGGTPIQQGLIRNLAPFAAAFVVFFAVNRVLFSAVLADNRRIVFDVDCPYRYPTYDRLRSGRHSNCPWICSRVSDCWLGVERSATASAIGVAASLQVNARA